MKTLGLDTDCSRAAEILMASSSEGNSRMRPPMFGKAGPNWMRSYGMSSGSRSGGAVVYKQEHMMVW